MDTIVAQKRCSKCGKTKEVSGFHKDKSSPDRFYCYCKPCTSEYRVASREQARKYNRAYHAAHRDKANRCSREYHAAHLEQMAENNRRRRALQTNAEGNGITVRQWKSIKEQHGYLCAYCCQKKPLQMDHIVPLSKGGRHDPDNIVPACKSCNSGKRDLSLLEFLQRRNLTA